MKREFETALIARRAEIRARWQEMLFVEPVTSPLAHPRTLSFLLDQTLDRVFVELRRGGRGSAATRPECACGRNPFLAYFRAGNQALLEALVLVLAATPGLDAAERDAAFADLQGAIDRIASEEIATFGSLCKHRESVTPADADHGPGAICSAHQAQ